MVHSIGQVGAVPDVWTFDMKADLQLTPAFRLVEPAKSRSAPFIDAQSSSTARPPVRTELPTERPTDYFCRGLYWKVALIATQDQALMYDGRNFFTTTSTPEKESEAVPNRYKTQAVDIKYGSWRTLCGRRDPTTSKPDGRLHKVAETLSRPLLILSPGSKEREALFRQLLAYYSDMRVMVLKSGLHSWHLIPDPQNLPEPDPTPAPNNAYP
ncbi:hypothetical protein G7046_g104 [Stylonectria norvegica]|nr:hypothetical protein G7046_g104 [Stylonectria norvegica]